VEAAVEPDLLLVAEDREAAELLLVPLVVLVMLQLVEVAVVALPPVLLQLQELLVAVDLEEI
jgi:hypothetical protein